MTVIPWPMWLTLIPVHELKRLKISTFALGPEDTDTLVKSGETRSGQPSVQNYGACDSLTIFTTRSLLLSTITYPNDEKVVRFWPDQPDRLRRP